MKTVLITGANKGIGLETARQMAQRGYFVYLGSRDKNKGQDAVNQLHQMGLSDVALLPIDVSDINSVKDAKSALESTIEALDILINNAGITGVQPQNMSACDIALLRNVFDTNFFGTIQTTQAFIPLLQKSSEPVIVNVSSELGSLTMQTTLGKNPGWTEYQAYGASKTALNALTVMLANEFGDKGFRINSVSPGYTATDLNNHQGTKPVEEGAKLIVDRATANDDKTGQFFTDEGATEW